MPGFRPLNRTQSQGGQRAPDGAARNHLDDVPLSELIRKNFGMKPSKQTEEPESGDENDELIGDTNFDTTGFSADFFNTFQGFDDEELEAEGFQRTNQYQKAEFNEPAPRRFGSRVRKSTPRWKKDETELFYRVLSMCGTDFSMISKFFPTRTRKMIVNKFHCEEMHNMERVQAAINNPQSLDLSLYAATVGIDEGSILEDYKKNKDKVREHGTIQARPKAQVQEDVAEEEDKMSEWEDIPMQSDKEDDKIASDDGSGDEIEGEGF